LTRLTVPFVGGDAQETANRLAVVKGELEMIRRTRIQKNCA